MGIKATIDGLPRGVIFWGGFFAGIVFGWIVIPFLGSGL